MPPVITKLTNFNRYPVQTCTVLRPERYSELFNLKGPIIARGQGCSYSDSALNNNGQVLLTGRLNCFLEFNREQGIITVEAGVTLAEVLDFIVPQGWFLPVTPGTQFASIGGCVAADVHGKNHSQAGSFGHYILWLELICGGEKIIYCSAEKNAEILAATIGGMGLTGIISKVSLKLMPISSSYLTVTQYSTSNLEQTLNYLFEAKNKLPYGIAWLDMSLTGNNLGGGVIMLAQHTNKSDLPFELQHQALKKFRPGSLSIPSSWAFNIINKTTAKCFNQLYGWRQRSKAKPFIANYQQYFYPLDQICRWSYLFGKQGFVQYQCVLPIETALTGIQQILLQLQNASYPIFLATLKQFGAGSSGLLSFPMPGFTLALDLPLLNDKLFLLLNKMDEIVAKLNGRICLAKDVRLSPELFRAMYPNYQGWQTVKEKLDSNWLFYSSMAKRLEMV